MKKSLVIITLLLVLVSAFSVNALVTKRTAIWGFGMKVTGMAAAEAVCTDSDNSYSYNMSIFTASPSTRPDAYVFGIVNYTLPTGSIFVKDACYNGTHMAEQFCQQGKYKGTQGITCANGCSDGACLVNPIISVNTCTDLDNGVNYSVATSITGTYNGNNFTWPDYCNNETTLYEMFCGGPDSSSPSFNIHTCPYGCSNSACLPPPVITPGCHDVEASFHISGPGTTYNPFRIQLNSAVVFIVNNVEYLVNFTSINDTTATFIVNGELISLRPPQTRMLGNNAAFRLLSLNNTSVCGSDGKNYESACLAGAAGAAVSCTGSCPCPPPVCIDSDNGINASLRGHLTIVKASPEWADDCCVIPGGKGGCMQNGTHVVDYYCSPNNPQGYDSITLPCPNGCAAGACLPATAIVGPAPVPITAGEQVTCQFLFAKSTQTCSSPKGRCSAPRNNPKCTIQVSGTPGEKINWTSTCGTPAVVTTTIDATNENAVFVCGSFRVPNIRFP